MLVFGSIDARVLHKYMDTLLVRLLEHRYVCVIMYARTVLLVLVSLLTHTISHGTSSSRHRCRIDRYTQCA
jgi:hypothetical protein